MASAKISGWIGIAVLLSLFPTWSFSQKAPGWQRSAHGRAGPGHTGSRDRRGGFQLAADGSIRAGGRRFESWQEYWRSDYFTQKRLRCGTRVNPLQPFNSGDCTLSSTNPAAEYDPGGTLYQIPVVVHVIQNSSGVGFLGSARIESQIAVLNEDYRAIAGSLGENGTDTGIEFFLATEDPDGNPTNGITYTTNDLWFNDLGNYWDTLAWDPSRYLNIYTNAASGFLGYASIAQDAAGAAYDRVVILYEVMGINQDVTPYHLGRVGTHEVGHYLGLLHVFHEGCGNATECYTTGDLICDTNPQSDPTLGCPGSSSSCGSPDNSENYMDYSDHICMTEFTPEQARRMRCSLENYRCGLVSCETEQADACANATEAFDGPTFFNTTGATTDGPNEPGVCDFSGYTQVGSDVWFRYDATCTGDATVSLCGSSYDTKVAVYEGSCPTEASAIACNDDSGSCGAGSLQSEVSFPATEGTSYLIRIGGFDGATGFGQMTISCQGEILGDFCSDAVLVVEGTTFFDSTGATTDGPDEPGVCSFFGYTHVESDIWFHYQPSCTGTVVASLCGSSYDTKIAVYEGACPTTESAIACNEDSDKCGVFSFQSEVSFGGVSGNSYYIRVGGFEGDSGSGQLTIECLGGGGPPGDFCADAVEAFEGVTPFDTTGATTDGPAEPLLCFESNYVQVGRDIWFFYEASCSGIVTVSLCGSSYDTKIAVYESSCPVTSSAITCNDDSCGLQSSVTFAAVSGATYYLRVGGYLGDTGSGEMTISCEGVGGLCGPDEFLTHSANPTHVELFNSIACVENPPLGDFTTTDNSYWRTFGLSDFGINQAITVTSVEVGIEFSAPGVGFMTQPLFVRLYEDANSTPAPVSSLNLLYEEEFAIGNVFMPSLECLSLARPVSVSSSVSNLVAEIHVPDATDFGSGAQHEFFLGSNGLGESDDSFFSSDACGNPQPVTYSSIGFPDVHLVMNLYYESVDCPLTPPTSVTCTQVGPDVDLTWDEESNDYAEVEILRDDAVVGMIAGRVAMFTDVSVPLGAHEYRIRGIGSRCVVESDPCRVNVEPLLPDLLRGDANGDGTFNGLIDGIYTLEFQFQNGSAPSCLESADSDGDGVMNGLVDSLYIFAHQFQFGPPPPPPYPDCGQDPNPASSLGCESHPGC